jgi:hypothetical protein
MRQPQRSLVSSSGSGSSTVARRYVKIENLGTHTKPCLRSRFINIIWSLQDSGKTITSSHLGPIFDEEAQKVAKIAGISTDHVNVAKGYMMAQLSKQWPSDFLTSDLYAQLDSNLPKGKL